MDVIDSDRISNGGENMFYLSCYSSPWHFSRIWRERYVSAKYIRLLCGHSWSVHRLQNDKCACLWPSKIE